MMLGHTVILSFVVLVAESRSWSVAGGNSATVNISDVIPYYARSSRSMHIESPQFRPRAIPLHEQENVYYTPNKYKSEILFPGNYFTIAKEKSDEKPTNPAYTPINVESFKPIPLRGQEFQSRSLDEETELEEDSEATASRRSLSYVLGVDEDEENEDEEGDEDIEEEGEDIQNSKSKIKHRLKKAKKYSKYMMPLLLAYKLKYFALVPVLISGLILLIGATGMAGFFFALFAAVMGLQKGSY